MTWTQKIPRPTWLILGLIVGLVVVPTAAVASTVIVIAGANHQNVNGTADSQLLTTEAAPSSYEVAEVGKDGVNGCFEVPTTLTKSSAFILKSAEIDIWSLSGSGPYINASIYNGPSCGTSHIIGDDNPATVGATSLSFGAGYAVAKGKELSVYLDGDIGAEVYLYGYKVPSADVPASTKLIQASGFDGSTRHAVGGRSGNIRH
jgi:hypothetical protein